MKVTSTRSWIVQHHLAPIPPSPSPRLRLALVNCCRRAHNINIYHKITFLATAHFITHIVAIFTQDTRMNYYMYLERAPIKRNRAPRVGDIDRASSSLADMTFFCRYMYCMYLDIERYISAPGKVQRRL